MDRSSSSSIAFLLGVIAGGVAGLLFAPKSGKETRSDLHQIFQDAEETLARKKDELMEAAAKETEKLKKSASETFEKEKKKFTESVAKFKPGKKNDGKDSETAESVQE